MQIDAPEHSEAQNARAFAYVRPHDLDVQRYRPGSGQPEGIVVRLDRAIVVGPIARLELIPVDATKAADNASPESPDRSADPCAAVSGNGFSEGDVLVVTPRRARVFLDQASGIDEAPQGRWTRRRMIANWFDNTPRRVLAFISVACVAMLAFGLYLQHVVGLEPCPMCIVQRYALILVAVFAGLASARGKRLVDSHCAAGAACQRFWCLYCGAAKLAAVVSARGVDVRA